MRHQPNTLVFDIGGVLLDWNPRHLYRKLFRDASEMEVFLRDVCSQAWNEKQDAGRSFSEATAELIQRHPEQAELIQAYDDRWLEMICGPIEGTVTLFEQLHQNGHDLFGLSNWSSEKYLVAKEQFPFLRKFKDVLVSGEVQLIKPNPKIFDLLLHRIDKLAEDCLFIDDSTTNIDAAGNLGFHTIHFHDSHDLSRQLNTYGFSC